MQPRYPAGGLIHRTGTGRPVKCSGCSSGQEVPPRGAELPALRGDKQNSSVKSVLKARRKGPSKGDLVCGVEGAGQPQMDTSEGASPEKGGGRWCSCL